MCALVILIGRGCWKLNVERSMFFPFLR